MGTDRTQPREYRIVTNGNQFMVQWKNSLGIWADRLWTKYDSLEAAQLQLHVLKQQDEEVWEPVQ